MSHQYEKGDSPLRKLSDLVLGQWGYRQQHFRWLKKIPLLFTKAIYKKMIIITNKNNEYSKIIEIIMIVVMKIIIKLSTRNR